MVNILPTETKRELKKNYLWRRRLVAVASLVVVGLISLVLGVTLYFIVEINQGGMGEFLKKKGVGDESRSYDELMKELKKTAEMVRKVSALSHSSPSSVLAKITELKNSGIRINDYEFVKSPEGIEVVIKGKSSSRKSLTDFLDSVKSSTYFLAVDSPLSNLINEGESEYTVTLLLATSTSQEI